MPDGYAFQKMSVVFCKQAMPNDLGLKCRTRHEMSPFERFANIQIPGL